MEVKEFKLKLCDCAKCVKDFVKKGTVPLECVNNKGDGNGKDIHACYLFKDEFRNRDGVYLMVHDRPNNMISDITLFPRGVEIKMSSEYIDHNKLDDLLSSRYQERTRVL